MRKQCIQAVSNVLGRAVTIAESRNIEARIKEKMRDLAMADPQNWSSLTTAQRLHEAAKQAAQELVNEARLKKQRIILSIQAYDRASDYIEDQITSNADENGLESIARMLAPKNDGKNRIQSLESQQKGIVASAMSQLMDAFDAISPKFLGILRDAGIEEMLIRAFHGDQINDPRIQKAAKAWLDQTEILRKRFNAAGGQIGRLVDWGMPHSWSTNKVNKIGQDVWVTKMMGWIDRSKYVHEDGTPFNDPEMEGFLQRAWLTIATNGATKVDPTIKSIGGGIKANRHSHSRELHFIDGAAAYQAFREFSDKNLAEVMMGHVRSMAKDIATVETFGPNSDYLIRSLIDREYKKATIANPSSEPKLSGRIEEIEHLYNYLAGNSPAPVHSWMANIGEDVRNILSAAALGSAPITAITDEGTMYLTAHVNRVPMLKLFLNEISAMNPLNRTEKRLAARAGLMVHAMSDSMRRFSSENAGPRFSSRLANFSIRISGLSAWTNARRRAFSLSMMDSIGAVTRDYPVLADVPAVDHDLLLSKGITDRDWAIWVAAKPETMGGNYSVLTPESIFRSPVGDLLEKQRAASKLMGIILEEQDIAVIEPGARERAGMTLGSRSGTLKGEIVRSFFLFKSFPITMMHKHWERALNKYDRVPGKAGYLAALIAAQTLLGAVAMEINDILSGKNPRELAPGSDHWKRNWIAAFLKGGALGLYGDFLFNETTANDKSFVASLMGPVAGLVEGIDDLGRGNLIQYMDDRPTNFGAEAVRLAKTITPGSNLWYAKAALDHMIFQEMQEYFSPGYMARVKNMAYQRQGTTYWWEPGQDFNRSRAPDLSTVMGR